MLAPLASARSSTIGLGPLKRIVRRTSRCLLLLRVSETSPRPKSTLSTRDPGSIVKVSSVVVADATGVPNKTAAIPTTTMIAAVMIALLRRDVLVASVDIAVTSFRSDRMAGRAVVADVLFLNSGKFEPAVGEAFQHAVELGLIMEDAAEGGDAVTRFER